MPRCSIQALNPGRPDFLTVVSQDSSSLMVAWMVVPSLRLQSKILPRLQLGFSGMDGFTMPPTWWHDLEGKKIIVPFISKN